MYTIPQERGPKGQDAFRGRDRDAQYFLSMCLRSASLLAIYEFVFHLIKSFFLSIYLPTFTRDLALVITYFPGTQ